VLYCNHVEQPEGNVFDNLSVLNSNETLCRRCLGFDAILGITMAWAIYAGWGLEPKSLIKSRLVVLLKWTFSVWANLWPMGFINLSPFQK